MSTFTFSGKQLCRNKRTLLMAERRIQQVVEKMLERTLPDRCENGKGSEYLSSILVKFQPLVVRRA